jgi:hypothetical protein
LSAARPIGYKEYSKSKTGTLKGPENSSNGRRKASGHIKKEDA